MKIKSSIKLLLIPAILFAVFFVFGNEAKAEHFFQQNSTWHTKIPANPILIANSSKYVDDIRFESATNFYVDNGEWSPPIFYATAETPNTTVTMYPSGQPAEQLGWNIIPIPPEALPDMNAQRCAGEYTDGMMVIVSVDRHWAWDFQGASKCNGVWSAHHIRKWDLTGDGIDSDPWSGYEGGRVAHVPELHGIITYNEVVNEGKIDHALAFAYNIETCAAHWSYYPTHVYNQAQQPNYGCADPVTRPYAMKLGERIQLDPTFDCNSISGTTADKLVCVALQEYGMIFVENAGPWTNTVYAEQLINKPISWTGIFSPTTDIPLDKLRVVEPVCSDCTRCPNCVATDTTPPAAPSGLQVQ